MAHDHGSPADDASSPDTRGDGHKPNGDDLYAHHAAIMKDFRRRFFVSLAATLPILALSPMIQQWLGLREALGFAGDTMVRSSAGSRASTKACSPARACPSRRAMATR
ncbi:MAG: hypothetical protein V5A22_12780 [Salinivenus sp.]